MSESHLDTADVLDQTLDGVFIVDRQRRVLLFNRACEQMTGFRREEVVGTQCRCHDITQCEDEHGRSLVGKLCPGLQVFDGAVPSARQRVRIRGREGNHIWTETSYTPLTGPDGEVACVLAVVRDISALKTHEDELQQNAENLQGEVEHLRGEMRQRYGFSTIITRNAKMEDVLGRIQAAGKSDSPVLISGEAGSGKELVARTIHYYGQQKDGPFVPVNCSVLTAESMDGELFGYVRGAMPGAQIDYQGVLRAADGGTVFLDEITALTPGMQAKLLQVLADKRVRPLGSSREKPVNVRVIAATSLNPAKALASGTLRQDLYYRLAVVAIDLPPLRERKEDVPYLAEYFISQLNRRANHQIKSVAPDVWSELLRYDWPGNVRELLNAIESAFAVASGSELTTRDLPNLVVGGPVELRSGAEQADLPLDDVLASVERQAILAALRRAGGQRSRAARAISISRSRLYRRMEALGIRPREDV